MATKKQAARDPRVDAYIAKAAPFARPILEHLRALIHEASPGAAETIKWSMPFFSVDGALLAHMAAFKAHVAFGFWHGRGIVADAASDEAMGQFGRLGTLADLPAKKVLIGYVKQAVKRNATRAQAPKAERPKKTAKPAPVAPDDLVAALKKHRQAQATYAAFSPSCQREYVDWIVEAKRAETRASRIAQAVEWMAQGKQRNWKYQNC